jgi:hypothetical protein
MTSEHSFKKWQIFYQRDEFMDLDDFLEDDEDDVLIRMQHDDGTTVTFLTAPPEVFTERDQLEPLLFSISETDICIAFNSDLLESKIKEAVERNCDTYSAKEAAFLPITMILNKGLKAVDMYKAANKLDGTSSEMN